MERLSGFSGAQPIRQLHAVILRWEGDVEAVPVRQSVFGYCAITPAITCRSAVSINAPYSRLGVPMPDLAYARRIKGSASRCERVHISRCGGMLNSGRWMDDQVWQRVVRATQTSCFNCSVPHCRR